MNRVIAILVRRYARAFIQVFPDACEPIIEQQAMRIKDFFSRDHALPVLIDTIPHDVAVHDDFVHYLMRTLEIPASIHALISMLIHHRRLQLLVPIMEYIVSQCHQAHGMHDVMVESSHQLTEQERTFFERLFAQQIGASRVRTTYQINPDLIAGIRMRSAFFLWEHSINKQLREYIVPLVH